jgi:hypothetical protein
VLSSLPALSDIDACFAADANAGASEKYRMRMTRQQ